MRVRRILALLALVGGVFLLTLPGVVVGRIVLAMLEPPPVPGALPGLRSMSFDVAWGLLCTSMLGVLAGLGLVWAGLRLWRPGGRRSPPPPPHASGPPLSRAELVRVIEGWEEGHVVIRLADGRTLEGWAWFEDGEPDLLTFSHAPGPWSAEGPGEERIPLDHVARWLDEDRSWRTIESTTDA